MGWRSTVLAPCCPRRGRPLSLLSYIFDSNHELQHCLDVVPSFSLDPAILRQLQEMMHEHTPYVQQFKYAAAEGAPTGCLIIREGMPICVGSIGMAAVYPAFVSTMAGTGGACSVWHHCLCSEPDFKPPGYSWDLLCVQTQAGIAAGTRPRLLQR